MGNKLSEGVVGLRIADYRSRSLYELYVLVNIAFLHGRRSFVQTVMMRMKIIVLELRVGVGILRKISGIWCWIMRLRLGLGLILMILVEVLMHVAIEPRRMAADTAQTEQIAAKS